MRLTKIRPLDPARVAFLKCRGLSQSVIAKRLDLGEATVSRLLSEQGAAHKYIKSPQFDWSQLTKHEKAELQAMNDVDGLSEKLTKKLGNLPAVPTRLDATVVASRTDSSTAETHRRALPADFCEGAFSAVWDLLTPANFIGVTWGRTLGQLLDAARRARVATHYEGERQPMVIPLCGASLRASGPTSFSSSALAQGFGELLTTRPTKEYLSLAMIPVFLPGPTIFDDREVAAVKKLLRYSPAFTRIFGDGGERPYADQLDIVITSISREGWAFGVGDNTFWRDLELRQFERMMLGDVGGVPLIRPEYSSADLKELLVRWTGVHEHHLRRCAERASGPAGGPAGVILVAQGRERAVCVREAVRLGLVNHAVVDEELGRTLLELLD